MLNKYCSSLFAKALKSTPEVGSNSREKASPHTLHNKNCCDLNLGESLCTATFFLFSDSGLILLNGFDFYSGCVASVASEQQHKQDLKGIL